MELDRDLLSIQQARNLMSRSKAAQGELAGYDQERIDRIVKRVCEACEAESERLAKMAVEETGFGVWQDKVLKNLLGSRVTYDYIEKMKTVGIIEKDPVKKIWHVATPMGIVVALVPSTNPTSTVMYKSLVCLKSGNSVIFSPHPNAKNCILETVGIIRKALKSEGVPEDAICAVSMPTIEATNVLMSHSSTGMILATGGPGMVKAAYSSGNPAIGVGSGNTPAFIERTADIPAAIRRIFASKCFDNGTICASEQSIVTEHCIREKVEDEARRQGGHFLNEADSAEIAKVLLKPNGSMNPAIVGRDAKTVADLAGVKIPDGTRVLLSQHTEVGEYHPYSREKLCPVLGFFVEDSWEAACERSIELLKNEGAGHTLSIHSEDESVIQEFALRKPVMRVVVNNGSALGAVGATTGLAPALTLGCGTIGGSSTSDNVTPLNLINVRRVAWGTKEIEELRGEPPICSTAMPNDNRALIEKIAKEVLKRLS